MINDYQHVELRINARKTQAIRYSTVVSRVMWGTVLLLALVAMADPVRIGIAVLLLSRPRPMLNLLAFWLGGIAMCFVAGLGVVFALRDFALVVIEDLASMAASSIAGHVKFAVGVLALLIAALMAVGFRARQWARVPTPGGDPSVLMLQPNTPSAFPRLSTRAQDVLKGGSLWVGFVVGLGFTAPASYLGALAAVLVSGAAAGTQISAVVAYAFVAFAVVAITIVSQLAAPTKTRALILQGHSWVRARNRQVFAIIIAAVGAYLVTCGMCV
jgi:hypothetical protein